MSSDNFFVIQGDKVWMGFASDYDDYIDRARRRWFRRLLNRTPCYQGEDPNDAQRWAWENYSEHGVWHLPDLL